MAASENIKGMFQKILKVVPQWLSSSIYFMVQKQPPELFYEKRCSQKFRKIYRKTPVPGSLRNFIKKETLAQVSSCEFAKFLRTTLIQNTSRQLLLTILTYGKAFKFFITIMPLQVLQHTLQIFLENHSPNNVTNNFSSILSFQIMFYTIFLLNCSILLCKYGPRQ